MNGQQGQLEGLGQENGCGEIFLEGLGQKNGCGEIYSF